MIALDLHAGAGAGLPQVIQGALNVAHACRCGVTFTWLGKLVCVYTSDTYQGVQRKVQRLLNPDKQVKKTSALEGDR